MRWCWLAEVADSGAATGSLARAELHDADGRSRGLLAAWAPGARPRRLRAGKVDARAVDPGGAEGWLSLVLAPPRVRLPFDDLAVQGARRAVLAGPPARVVSTLVRLDWVFAGAVTVRDDAAALEDDPFARVFPARVLRVGPGLFGAVPHPAGPVIERYGSGTPWPWDRFADPEDPALPRRGGP